MTLLLSCLVILFGESASLYDDLYHRETYASFTDITTIMTRHRENYHHVPTSQRTERGQHATGTLQDCTSIRLHC